MVILSDLVGIRTGPLTWRSLSLAPVIKSWQTRNRANMGRYAYADDRTFLECLDISAGEGDADATESILLFALLKLSSRHFFEPS